MSLRLKVITKYWNEMRQATEIKQETRQINSSVTASLHGRRGELTGLKPFFGLENVQSVSHRGVLLDANAFFLHPSLSLNLKVTIKYWSAMRQAAEIKQETRQINSSVTVMSHGRKGELIGVVSFCGLGNVQARPFRGVSWDHSAFSFQSSLSRNLTAKPAFSASRSRLRRAALPLSETFSAEARSALSVPSVLLDVPASATVAVASRAKADSQQIRHSLTLKVTTKN